MRGDDRPPLVHFPGRGDKLAQVLKDGEMVVASVIPPCKAPRLDPEAPHLDAEAPRDPEMVAGWPAQAYDAPSVYWQGNDTQPLPRSMHKEHRAKLLRLMQEAGAAPGGLVLVQGGVARERNDTDHEPIFRQESNFHYLFGVAEPDCFGTIETDSGRTALFVPRLPPEYAVWMGAIASPQDFQLKYEVDAVHYVDELASIIAGRAPSTIYVYSGINTDSGARGVAASFDGISAYTVADALLHPVLFVPCVTLRVYVFMCVYLSRVCV